MFAQGAFPQCLKNAKTIPIFKKGDKLDPASYRPISIIPILSKVLELCIKKQLLNHLVKNNSLSQNQYGFRPDLSTTIAVDKVVSEILHTFELNSYLGITLVDLSKAFDSVSHQILLEKLTRYGIRNNGLNLIKTYLCGRYQSVVVNNQSSTYLEVMAGVPQGSILGPLLFLLAINDLPISLPFQSLLYADDTTFLVTGSSQKEIDSKSNLIYERAAEWFKANALTINATKTEKMCFSLRRLDANTSNSVKLLGVHLDPKLSWETHTDHVISKLSRVCFLLRRLRTCVSQDVVKLAYFSLFHSHLLYANMLWGNCSNAKQVFIWQKRALRIIAGVSDIQSCRPLFKNFNIMTLPSIFIYSNLVYVKKNLNKFLLRNFTHNYSTRKNHEINIPQFRLAKSTSSHKFLQVKLFNSLPETSHLIEEAFFKKKLSKWLLQNAFYSIDEFLNCDTASLFSV